VIYLAYYKQHDDIALLEALMHQFTLKLQTQLATIKDQGAKGPGSELARSYLPIRSWERIGPGVKRLGTVDESSCRVVI